MNPNNHAAEHENPHRPNGPRRRTWLVVAAAGTVGLAVGALVGVQAGIEAGLGTVAALSALSGGSS